MATYLIGNSVSEYTAYVNANHPPAPKFVADMNDIPLSFQSPPDTIVWLPTWTDRADLPLILTKVAKIGVKPPSTPR